MTNADSNTAALHKEWDDALCPIAWTIPTMLFFCCAVPMTKDADPTYVIQAIGIQIVLIDSRK
jgi:hypothetical protein